MRNFIDEIKRRNVIRVAIVYVVAGWLTMQVVDVMFPALKIPDWVTSMIAALLLIGFPFALIFAWAFELTPDGIKREKDVVRDESITHRTGQKLNNAALIILAIAVVFLLADKFWLRPTSSTATSGREPEAVVDTKPSLAVLPFVNMSGDAEDEYFSDGLSEELLNVLARIPELHVAGRTSSFAFKGLNEDLRAIGDKLNVTNILEGSVRRSGNQLRITAQLVNAETGYHLWSDSFDRELTDIFVVQDEIAAAVSQALKVTLLGRAIQTNRGTENLEAYELFLKARYLLEHTSEENLYKARDAADRALELDPEYANAWFMRAIIEQRLVSGWATLGSDFDEGNKRVRQLALEGLKHNQDSAEAYFILGVVSASGDWDFDEAIANFRRAIELNPSHTPAYAWLGSFLMSTGRLDESIEVLETALDIDPLFISNIRSLGDAYYFSGNSEKAMSIYRSILELNPEVSRVYGRMSRVALTLGDIDLAAEYAANEPVDWVRELAEVFVLSFRGDEEAWRTAADAYAAQWGDLNSYQNAEMYALGGDIEAAFKWLETARRVRDPGNSFIKGGRFSRAIARRPEVAGAPRGNRDGRLGLYRRSVNLLFLLQPAAVRDHAIVKTGNTVAAGFLEHERQNRVHAAAERGLEH